MYSLQDDYKHFQVEHEKYSGRYKYISGQYVLNADIPNISGDQMIIIETCANDKPSHVHGILMSSVT